jgi:rare lipoprotein A
MKRILSVAVAAGILLSGCGGRKRARLPVAARIGATETGTASWYGRPYHGRRAANGEIYDMEKMTAAHRTLPFGTWLEVKNLSNDKAVKVRIIDRGPFVGGRILDLSHAAAVSIAMVGPGIATVKCTVIASPVSVADDSVSAVVPQLAPGPFAVQTGSFADRRNAERLRASMERRYGTAKLVVRDAQPVQWRVLVGREATEGDAAALADRIRTDPDAQATAAFVVRLDEPAPDSIQ